MVPQSGSQIWRHYSARDFGAVQKKFPPTVSGIISYKNEGARCHEYFLNEHKKREIS